MLRRFLFLQICFIVISVSDWRNMSVYPAIRAKQDFRKWRITTNSIAVAAAISNLFLAVTLPVNCLVFLMHLACKQLGPEFAQPAATAFHTFVYGCLVLFLLTCFSVIFTSTHHLIGKEVNEEVRLREKLYREIMTITG